MEFRLPKEKINKDRGKRNVSEHASGAFGPRADILGPGPSRLHGQASGGIGARAQQPRPHWKKLSLDEQFIFSNKIINLFERSYFGTKKLYSIFQN